MANREMNFIPLGYAKAMKRNGLFLHMRNALAYASGNFENILPLLLETLTSLETQLISSNDHIKTSINTGKQEKKP